MPNPFRTQIRTALDNPDLQSALDGNAERRQQAFRHAYASLPEDFEVLRQRAHAVRARSMPQPLPGGGVEDARHAAYVPAQALFGNGGFRGPASKRVSQERMAGGVIRRSRPGARDQTRGDKPLITRLTHLLKHALGGRHRSAFSCQLLVVSRRWQAGSRCRRVPLENGLVRRSRRRQMARPPHGQAR